MNIQNILKRNLTIKTVSLILSLMLWFYAATDQTVDIRLRTECNFKNIKDSLAISNINTTKVDILFKGKSRDFLIMNLLRRKPSISINLFSYEKGLHKYPIFKENIKIKSFKNISVVNVLYPNDIEFEIDKTYRYVCLSDRKKNYFGVLEDGEVDVKGLTGKKKHTPKIIKNVFNETKKVLSEIETPEQMEIGKQKIIELIKNAYFMFKNRSWKNIEDLAFHVTINKELEEYTKTTPQHVKAARLLTEKGYQVGVGSVISFIKTNKKISGITVKPVETTKTRDVDITKYIEILKSTFEQILDPLD